MHKGRKIGVRSGSFFKNSLVPFATIIMVLWCWAEEIPGKKAARWTGLGERHLLSWYAVRPANKIIG